MSLVRILTSLNRGMRALERSLGRSGFQYVAALTVLVNFAGAAGMYYFENPAALREAGFEADPSTGLGTYGEAVWWTAMLLTTLGTDYFPKTSEGRLLCWLLSVYAFSIFGYITATVARFLLKNKAQREQPPGTADVASLARQVDELRRELNRLSEQLAVSTNPKQNP